MIMMKNHADAASILRQPHVHVLAFPFVPYGIEEEPRDCQECYARKKRYGNIVLYKKVIRCVLRNCRSSP